MEDDENDEYEPQITSEDPEERKLARRLRIQRRIETIKKQRELDGQEVITEIEKSLLDKQTEASADVLEKLLVEGEEVVSNVKVGNETREVTRRAKESQRRAEILDKLQNESDQAEAIYEEICSKWDIICKYNDPLDINSSINSQKELCNGLIKQKDEIINMLKEEVNLAELRYVLDQDSQKEDIATLVKRIDDQINLMRKSYRDELVLIESAIATERQMLLDVNNKKWDALYKQRNIDEDVNMVKKIDMADEFLQIFYDTRVKHEEIYRETKITLDTEIEVLQKELEILKASCLLNSEKLDYNYNILKKREEENIIVRSQQKRLINKLQDAINKVRRNMKAYKEESQETINKLMIEITKERNSIFQIESKADHICEVNNRKYLEVWQLNEKKAKMHLNRIKTTDKIIHEQLLGLDWKPPSKYFIKKTSLASYKEAEEILNSSKQDQIEIKTKLPILKFEEGKELPHSFLQSIFDNIAFRSGFLLEKTLRDLLPTLEKDSRQLVRADNVFSAIGVTKTEHLKTLADLFMPYARCPICEASEKDSVVVTKIDSKTNQFVNVMSSADSEIPSDVISIADQMNEINIIRTIQNETIAIKEIVASELDNQDDFEMESSEKSTPSLEQFSEICGSVETENIVYGTKSHQFLCKHNHPVYVDHANVYKILRNFVNLGHGSNEGTMSLEHRLERRRDSLSRLLSESDVQLFWSQFTDIFPKENEDLWKGLLYGLKKYYAVLQDRMKIYQEVQSLRKENAELRQMLKFCKLPKKC